MTDVRASVLIPVKNGGPLLGEVLDTILKQQAPWPFEIIVVDSGSRDGSVELVRDRGVRCEVIASEEFGHGRTRNFLASLAKGEFLVFLTQDAKPASAHWLRHMVEACSTEESVAGAFGPHRAHPHARHVTHCELSLHFAGFGDKLSVVRLEDKNRFAVDPGYRQWLHFFSSNNSCIRRSVWERLPLPDVAFAEDQTWALRAIEAGYGKAYAPEAMVYHSHDFGVWETLQRNFDEARSFNLYFGYRIQDSLVQALKSGVHLAKRDLGWLRSGGLRGWRLFKNAGYMSLVEMARVAGQYLGTRHDRLPAWLLRSVSRDEQLQRAGAA
ncbi:MULTISPECIES: glycosyltransferase family 2 protein [unclassified Acidovorax]|uniref:glycosyltransferase family 2 protein n=1 Tax=unclassified Acidovorax TaxID=2684926 RepID=UPI001C477A41|nr:MULTISPECIES: glycosyltransferase family 2 protein [unclassified Acidovorax]MBV7428766.1 glycosyltransferase family 2 protein [Acidovorax sp. sif0732]MBV7450592.1 glycosyltransferase family 2 protein [Acidovorax sp. sif0715]